MSESNPVSARFRSPRSSSLFALALVVGGAIGTIGAVGAAVSTARSSSEAEPSSTVRLTIGPDTTTCANWFADYECPLMQIDGESSRSGLKGGYVEGLDYELGVRYVVDAVLRDRGSSIADLGPSYYEVTNIVEEGAPDCCSE